MKTLNELYNDSLQSDNINTRVIKILIAKYLKDNNLFSYFNGLKFDDSFPNMGCYNRKTLLLYLNLPLIRQNVETIDVNYRMLNQTNLHQASMELLNYYCLEAVYHELEHIKQNSMINHILFKDPISTILYASYRFASEDNYLDKHNLFPHEHSAEVYGSINAINFCANNNKYVILKKDTTIGTMLISEYQVNDNKVISPIEQLFDGNILNDLKYISANSKINDFTKLVYGLPISIDLYNQADQIANGKEKIKTLRGYKSC